MSRGGNDHRGFSECLCLSTDNGPCADDVRVSAGRPPDAPRSESSEHTHRRNTPPSTMESPSERPQPTRGGSPSGNCTRRPTHAWTETDNRLQCPSRTSPHLLNSPTSATEPSTVLAEVPSSCWKSSQ
ncbi:hypothetical protein FKP32DRAFT_1626467 [Trametes sanguinea]|nr:hypothetical protein FKP32DRAFT_1626467 [Trametes sanguinea]